MKITLLIAAMLGAGCTPTEPDTRTPPYRVRCDTICPLPDGKYPFCHVYTDTVYRLGPNGYYHTVPETTLIFKEALESNGRPTALHGQQP